MSGGSFNYIYRRDIEDMTHVPNELRDMADELERLGYAEDVTKATRDFIATIERTKLDLEARQRTLADVWQTMEWWRSGDCNENEFKKTLAKYRSSDSVVSGTIDERDA